MLANTVNNKPAPFTKDQLEIIGNTVIFLLQQDPHLNRAKMLQALFLVEETSWKKYVCPFFDIEFHLWKSGPVAKDIYIDLSEEKPVLLSAYFKRATGDAFSFLPLAPFNDDQFSENDLEILKLVTRFITNKSADELTRHNTGIHSLWYQNTLQYGILPLFEKTMLNSTDIPVDFSLLFTSDAEALHRYHSIKEMRRFIRQFKR